MEIKRNYIDQTNIEHFIYRDQVRYYLQQKGFSYSLERWLLYLCNKAFALSFLMVVLEAYDIFQNIRV